MGIFGYYVMVDWSGGSRRRGNRPDTIWIAHGGRSTSIPTAESPFSRTEATNRIREILRVKLDDDLRILLCCDFGYGYPKGFSAGLPTASGPAWKTVWSYLHAALRDDIGTTPGGMPTNRNNRFDVAEAINVRMSPAGGPLGPFWCLPNTGTRPHIPGNRPAQPFRTAQGSALHSLRLTDIRADMREASNTPFRLFGTGSVGGQVITGIPRLHALRTDPSLADKSAVWPFETGWATSESWLDSRVRVLHAEIYPSVRKPLRDTIRDRGQVRSMWKWARDLDGGGRLWKEFSIPAGIPAGSTDDIRIRSEEGWILGVGPHNKPTRPRRAATWPRRGPASTAPA